LYSFDELNQKITKIIEPLLQTKFYTLEVKRMFDNNKVVSVEGYDDVNLKKPTEICELKTILILNTSVANEPFPLIVSEAQRKRTRH
jgi:hypothetical protein